jgi:transcriptional regulator with XRE-family HTH domain
MSTANPFRTAFALDALDRSRAKVAMELRDSIKAWRQANSVTQAQMADLLGVSPQYLCDIEQGRRDISGQFIDAVLSWECRLPATDHAQPAEPCHHHRITKECFECKKPTERPTDGELLRRAIPVLESYAYSNPIHFVHSATEPNGVRQDPNGVHELLIDIRAAMSAQQQKEPR